MKRLFLLCITLLLLLMPLTSASCRQQSPTSSTPTTPAVKSKTYTNSEQGFSCQYPAEWDLLPGSQGIIVSFAAPMTNENGGMTGINITKAGLPGNPQMTFEDYVKQVETHLKNIVGSYEKLDEHSFTTAGVPAVLRTYTFDMEGTAFKASQAYLLKENTVYAISYGGIKDSYTRYAEDFDLVLNSFNLD